MNKKKPFCVSFHFNLPLRSHADILGKSFPTIFLILIEGNVNIDGLRLA